MTVTQLITNCARMINYIGRGQTLTSPESNDALALFNELNASWNRQSLMIFRTVRSEVSWASGSASRTIGSAGANITLPRPDRIIEASYINSTTTPALEIPIAVLQTIQQWQNVPQKAQTSTQPLLLYYDATISGEDGTIYIWPVPTSTITIALYLWSRMTTAWVLTDTITMPDGYLRMMRYNLAQELCGIWNMPVPQYVQIGAEESMGNIKSLNMTPRPIGCDPMSLGVGIWSQGIYDWRNDQWR